MASKSALLAIGQPDPYHGGIRPTHVLWLSENDVPRWVLASVWRELSGGPAGDGGDEQPPPWTEGRIEWIPSAPEQILADGLLLLAAHVLRDETVLELARQRLPELLDADGLDLTKLPLATLDELRDQCARTDVDCKLVLTVLGGSSLEGQLPILENYAMEVEVCTVTYSRTVEGWNGLQVRGSLTASWSPEGPTPDRYRAVNLVSTTPGALAESGAAPPGDLSESEELELFDRWVKVMRELKESDLIRSTNNAPVGEYAETLVKRRLNAKRPEGRDRGFDLVLPDRTKVQVKARRDPPGRSATHFDFRLLTDKRFNEFVGIVFNEDFTVKKAWIMPWETVNRLATDRGEGRSRLYIRHIDNEPTAKALKLD